MKSLAIWEQANAGRNQQQKKLRNYGNRMQKILKGEGIDTGEDSCRA